MFPISFQDLVQRFIVELPEEERPAVDLRKARLLRHDHSGLRFWRRDPAWFEHWASFQIVGSNSPYNECHWAFQFVPAALPEGAQGALFVCAHRVGDRWLYEGMNARRQPRKVKGECFEGIYAEQPGCEAFDLHRLHAFDVFCERILIHWSDTSHGTRAWSQWWYKTKPIVELRSRSVEESFPGFRDFTVSIDEIDLLPDSWRSALASVGGVYLLVCPETGLQYVGSATGAEGFLGRWSAYAKDGHGGNKHLKARKRRYAYQIHILELASPEMSERDVLLREHAWMRRLGTRVHGLDHQQVSSRSLVESWMNSELGPHGPATAWNAPFSRGSPHPASRPSSSPRLMSSSRAVRVRSPL